MVTGWEPLSGDLVRAGGDDGVHELPVGAVDRGGEAADAVVAVGGGDGLAAAVGHDALGAGASGVGGAEAHLAHAGDADAHAATVLILIGADQDAQGLPASRDGGIRLQGHLASVALVDHLAQMGAGGGVVVRPRGGSARHDDRLRHGCLLGCGGVICSQSGWGPGAQLWPSLTLL
ncbi:hypothetical protein CMI47_11785 [Candidatus Pacearchaeota archaeon]|nr:hypothetical protein [Candidatus Pacearchaeota archaeon]